MKTDNCSVCRICNNTEGSFTCIVFTGNYNIYLGTLKYPTTLMTRFNDLYIFYKFPNSRHDEEPLNGATVLKIKS